MKNTLGLSENRFEDIEKRIVNEKIKLLNEYCTFNCDKYDSEYLLKLNRFLFGDFYDDLKYRTTQFRGIIDSYLYILQENCQEKKDLDEIFERIQQLCNLQPFEVGNTRTFVAFIKIINETYNLGLDFNANFELYSGMNLSDVISTPKNK